jgi:hypothetical protein
MSGLQRSKLIYDILQSSIYYTRRAIVKIMHQPVVRKWKIDEQPILVVFADYEYVPAKGDEEAYYLYRHPLGVERLTPEEFNAVEWDIYSTVYQAKTTLEVDLAEFADQALARTAKLLGVPLEDLKAQMDQVVEELAYAPDDPLTVADIMGLPQWDRDSFLPEVLIFGPLHRAWGATYLLNYGLPQVVYYSTQAHLYDFLLNEPLVLEHEMVHSHGALQSIPLGWFFDVELFNALLTNLTPDDPINLLYHPYLRALRTFIKAMFGYDPEARRREIWQMSGLGYIWPDEEEWAQFDQENKTIAREIRWQVLNTLYPIFYSDPIYWASVATRLCNTHSIFFAIMSQIYSPTLLSDPSGELDRAAYTAKWIETHREVIDEIALKALAGAGERVDDPNQYEETIRALNWCPQNGEWSLPSDLQAWVLGQLRGGRSLKDIILDLLEQSGLSAVLGVGVRGGDALW